MEVRLASRIILISSDKYVLLMHGHDEVDISYSWWFTVGGGKKENETYIECAQRELAEETGLHLEKQCFIGPCIKRDAVFHFTTHDVRQREYFFLVYLDSPHNDIDYYKRTLTESEKKLIDRYEWLTLEEIEILGRSEYVFPINLVDILRANIHTWDGKCRKVHEK
ncbi:MAG: NUDIX domain-containing protein [Actinomycetaceae bacterium]|nr:NUDIX domain-containing protein [Actinomycetaceae bacterium]